MYRRITLTLGETSVVFLMTKVEDAASERFARKTAFLYVGFDPSYAGKSDPLATETLIIELEMVSDVCGGS